MTIEEIQKAYTKRMKNKKSNGSEWSKFCIPPKSHLSTGTSGSNLMGMTQKRLRVGKMIGGT